MKFLKAIKTAVLILLLKIKIIKIISLLREGGGGNPFFCCCQTGEKRLQTQTDPSFFVKKVGARPKNNI